MRDVRVAGPVRARVGEKQAKILLARPGTTWGRAKNERFRWSLCLCEQHTTASSRALGWACWKAPGRPEMDATRILR